MMDPNISTRGRAGVKLERQRAAAKRSARNAFLSGFTFSDENTSSRQPFYLVAGVLIVLSVVFRQPLLAIAALLIFVVGSIPEVWYRFGFAALDVERTLSETRTEIGTELTLTLRVENRKLLPMPRLELMDDLPREVAVVETQTSSLYDSSRQVLTNDMALLAFQRVVRRYRLRPLARGTYTFGPIKARSADPFGILTREQTYDLPARLIVYPLVVPIERLGLPARALLGEQRVDRSLLRDPVRIAGVRPYQPGDDPRRLHWKASARTGALQTKVLEPSAQHSLAIAIDLRTQPGQIMGYDPAYVELLVTTAASVARWGFERKYAVGLFSNGSLLLSDRGMLLRDEPNRPDTAQVTSAPALGGGAQPRLRLAASAHPDQQLRILDGLARLQPFYTRPIASTLAEEESRLPAGSTVVYCGAARVLTLETCAALERLRSRGHAVVVLLVGDEEVPQVALPMYRVGTAATWERLEEEALALRGVDRTGAPRAVSESAPSPRLRVEVAQ